MKAAGTSDQGASQRAAGAREANGSREGAAGIATALTEISERATLLIHEEIELAKAEVAQKVTKLARGAVVSVVAGVFVVTAVLFALIGCAWLLYFYLPVSTFAYFWGFFAMAVILLVLGALAGLIAARVLKASSPPVPNMAIEEARKIRETVSNGAEGGHEPPRAWSPASAPPPYVPPSPPPSAPVPPSAPTPPSAAAASAPAPTIDEATLQADPLAPPTQEPAPQADAGRVADRRGDDRRARSARRWAGPGRRAGSKLMAERSPAEIRSSIEENRMELAVSLDRLRGEVAYITDWRGHVERHQSEIVAGATVLGLLIGGRMLRRRRRRRR